MNHEIRTVWYIPKSIATAHDGIVYVYVGWHALVFCK